MDIREKQTIAMLLWRRYSITIDRMNRNAINRTFADGNQNVPVFAGRSKQWQYIYHEILKDEPIDYLEFGVFRGDSIHEWSLLSVSPESRFYGFDTFTGLPEPWFKEFGKDAFDTDGKIPELHDERVTFFKGLFQDTLSNFLKSYERKNRIVVHIDADLYSSTLFVLVSLHPYLKDGDVIMFDDFLDPLGEFRAFNDYCQAFRVKPRTISAVKYGKLFDKTAFML
ncbi:MAG: TylF/MycF family methyltransferase [Thermoplasmatales archaeon]|nr:TylF/MycF family methyltransferase [Thermoplasmatales archaeon]MCW6170426.1 TylF/MycF family methyltransferase [Thermoplasmatales archaeon]